MLKHVWLYTGVLISLFLLVIFSLGGGLWGAEKSIGHWTGNLFWGICHQLPQRSFTFNDVQMAVNSRCFGVFLGLLAGWIAIPVMVRLVKRKKWVLWFLFLAVIVQIIDYSGNLFHLWENTNVSRAVLGGMLGFSASIAVFDQFKTDK